MTSNSVIYYRYGIGKRLDGNLNFRHCQMFNGARKLVEGRPTFYSLSLTAEWPEIANQQIWTGKLENDKW